MREYVINPYELPLPRRHYIRIFDYAIIPLGVFITLFVALYLLMPFDLVWVTIWSLLVLGIGATSIYSQMHNSSGVLGILNLNGWIGHQRNGRIALLAWLLVASLYFLVALHGNFSELFLVIPAFFLPHVMFVLQKPREPRMTRRMMLYVSITILFIVVVTWQVAYRNSCPFWEINCGALQSKDFKVIAIIVLSMMWLGYFVVLGYYSVRRYQLGWGQLYAVHDFTLNLLRYGDPLVSSQKVLDVLFQRIQLSDRAFIVRYNSETDSLRVIAHVGKNAEVAVHEGRYIPKDKGLVREVQQKRCSIYVRNVVHYENYAAMGLDQKGSEFAVPIIVGQDGTDAGEVWGVISFQQDRTFGFSRESMQLAELLAETISSVAENHTSQFEQRMDERLLDFFEMTDSHRINHEVAEIARDLFDAHMVCYYGLAFGTGIPAHMHLIGGKSDEELLSWDNPNIQAILKPWLQDWRPVRIPDVMQLMEEDPKRTAVADIVEREQDIGPMVFMPVGSITYRLGALVLFFRPETVLSRSFMFKMRAFAREIAPHMHRAELTMAQQHGFAMPQLHIHSLMQDTVLPRGKWAHILELAEQCEGMDSTLQRDLRQLRGDINTFLERARSWVAIYNQRYDASGKFPLQKSLKDIRPQMSRLLPSASIHFQIDPAIEKEADELKMVLFIMVSEAISNSLQHGKSTTHCTVAIEREPEAICVRVKDDGDGFNPNVERRSQRYRRNRTFTGGIFAIDSLAQEILRTEPIEWLDTAANKGTSLIWRIPTLPIQETT